MSWRCELSLVLGRGSKGRILSLERMANDPTLGLNLLWTDLMKELSAVDDLGLQLPRHWTVIGFADKEREMTTHEESLRSQRLLDGSRRDPLGLQGTLNVEEDRNRE